MYFGFNFDRKSTFRTFRNLKKLRIVFFVVRKVKSADDQGNETYVKKLNDICSSKYVSLFS